MVNLLQLAFRGRGSGTSRSLRSHDWFPSRARGWAYREGRRTESRAARCARVFKNGGGCCCTYLSLERLERLAGGVVLKFAEKMLNIVAFRMILLVALKTAEFA